MKRALVPRPEWIRTCTDLPRFRQRHRLPGHRRRGIAVVGDQPRLHRPQSVRYAVRRHQTGPTTSTSTSTRAPGATFDQVRESSLIVRDALEGVEDEAAREDRAARKVFYSYAPHRARSGTKDSVGRSLKALAVALASRNPALMTSNIARRSVRKGACSSTTTRIDGEHALPASIPCGRLQLATVSTPLEWSEVSRARPHRGLPPR